MKTAKGLTIVIKLGTSSIVHEGTHEPRLSTLSVIVETAVKLRRDGHRVVLVSSGAIGVALQMMDLEKRPKSLPQVQALAALGQCRLMSLWDRFFMHLKQPVAQILLTRNDIADRTQYLNAQNTMNALLAMGVIPIVNENDTLSVAEIKFGDNDTLSAITAGMLTADYLFLMTDVDCLYTANPRLDPAAVPIPVVSDLSALAADVSSSGSALGTGGMSTKIVAAKLATAAGVTTVITRSSKPGNVADIVAHLEALFAAEADGNGSNRTVDPAHVHSDNDKDTDPQSASASEPPVIPPAPLHTRFLASPVPIRDRSFWLLHGIPPHGTLFIDKGAYRALRAKAGLLPVGIVGVEGNFAQQEAVRLVVVPRSAQTGTGPNPAKPGGHMRRVSSDTGVRGGVVPADEIADVEARPVSRRGLAGYESLDADLGAPPPDAPSTPSPRREGRDVLPREVGRALVNYAAPEIVRIKGLRSREIEGVLGYADSEYVALRENVSLFDGKTERPRSGTASGTASGSRATSPERTMPVRIGDLGSFA